MVEHVKRLKRELVYKGAILDIYKDTMELPDGNEAEWDFVSHRMGAAAILWCHVQDLQESLRKEKETMPDKALYK